MENYLGISFEVGSLLGLAALISAMGGLLATFWSIRKQRSEADEACYDKLKQVRADAEELAKELYEYKMNVLGGYGHEAKQFTDRS